MTRMTLKAKVGAHLKNITTEDELKAHTKHTVNTLESQKDYIKRIICERASDPMAEVDTIEVVNSLDENSICPFINGHLA